MDRHSSLSLTLQSACLEDSSPINDQSVGDDEVQRFGIRLVCGLPLTISKRFAYKKMVTTVNSVTDLTQRRRVKFCDELTSAKLAFVPVDGHVVLNLYPEVGISKPGSVQPSSNLHE